MKKGLICVVGIFVAFIGYGQSSEQANPSRNWFNEDAQLNNVNGVSTDQAYDLLKDRKSQTVVVAIIDSGIDIDHEDLRDVIWTNKDEIPDNGIDDDMNGYVDDIHGWNFLGGKDGFNVGPDNLEVTREYRRLKKKYKDKLPKKAAALAYYNEIEKGYNEGFNKAKRERDFYAAIAKNIGRYNQLLTAYLDVDELTIEKLKSVDSPDKQIMEGVNFMGNLLHNIGDMPLEEVIGELEEAANHYDIQVEFQYNLDYDPRSIIGDDYSNLRETGYGNNDVKGLDTDNFHGTHVAGIIAAKRGNNIGIDGIANNVKIMAVRTVPDGDEHDKDVANAIRYAVDNGAKVINMSFGKGYSPHKEIVDQAVKYAESKGVLLVHAAGNSSFDIDKKGNYPTKRFLKKGEAANWIEVGASGWGADNKLAASFSNYGKNTVDVFAPGVRIYSTAPGNEYRNAQGTSMASPVTAGIAAILFSYFPYLSAKDVKDILMQSSRKFDGLKVIKPGTKDDMVNFADLSISGGIVNAAAAIKLAESREISSSK